VDQAEPGQPSVKSGHIDFKRRLTFDARQTNNKNNTFCHLLLSEWIHVHG
jgi:hypothetical protein